MSVNLGAVFNSDGLCYQCKHETWRHSSRMTTLSGAPLYPCPCCDAEYERRSTRASDDEQAKRSEQEADRG